MPSHPSIHTSQTEESYGVDIRAYPILTIYITAYYMPLYLPITYISVRLEFLTDFIFFRAFVPVFSFVSSCWDLGFGIGDLRAGIVAVKGLGG